MSVPVRPAHDLDVPSAPSTEEPLIEPVTHVHEEPPTSSASFPAGSSAPDGLLGGVIPEDRPELLVAAAFAGGAVAAILLRTLVRR